MLYKRASSALRDGRRLSITRSSFSASLISRSAAHPAAGSHAPVSMPSSSPALTQWVCQRRRHRTEPEKRKKGGSYWVPGWWEEVWVASLQGLYDSRRGRREPTTGREDLRIWRYREWSISPPCQLEPSGLPRNASPTGQGGGAPPPSPAGACAATAVIR